MLWKIHEKSINVFSVVSIFVKMEGHGFIKIDLIYRAYHSKTIFLRWLKMTLKYIVHIKETYFYNHKDSPFDMKHQLMSADSLPVVKFDLSWKTIFHRFFFDFCRVNDLFAKLYFPLVSTWKSSTLSFMTSVGHILKFLESILMI